MAPKTLRLDGPHLMEHTELVLGIDIGGTNTKLGAIDRAGVCFAESVIPTFGDLPPETFFPRLREEVERLLQPLGRTHRLVGIGLGAPNGNFYRNTIEHPPNMRWGFVNLEQELSGWKVPIAVTNDANAAAYGEMLFGAAKGMRDFIVITLGTGLGSGIVVNGELVYGTSGFAGEIGHTLVERGGRPCGCGMKGCLETYASATGLLRTARELAGATAPWQSAREVHEAACKGDTLAREAFERTGTILGRKLAESVAHTSPEAIFLFGGLARAGELIFEPTRRALEENLFHVFRGTVQVLPSGVPSGHAAILGAGAMIWNKLGAKGDLAK